MTRWINTARRNLAKRTLCVRRLVSGQSAFGASAQPNAIIPGGIQPGATPGAQPNANLNGFASLGSLTTLPNIERYPYQGLLNSYAQKQHAGIEGLIDIGMVSANWGTAYRVALQWMPWMEFQAYIRASALLNSSYASYWSIMNDGTNGELWLGPVPTTAYDLELDAYCVPANLLSDNDYDAIPEHFREAIKYGAAALIYMQAKRYMEAAVMDGQYREIVGVSAFAGDSGKIPNFY